MTWRFWRVPAPAASDRQRQQVAASYDNVVETTNRTRHAALAENAAAAEGFKKAIDRRMDESAPLRDLLRKVIERQRAHQVDHS